MKGTKETYLKLKRTVNGLWRSLTMQDCMWISGDSEAKYLMSGHATELIDSVNAPFVYDTDADASIYGVVAADQSKRRYIWVYLIYRHHLWRCNNIAAAYTVIEKIKQHNKLQKKEWGMRAKMQQSSSTLKVCIN